jgi:hypothetical protein
MTEEQAAGAQAPRGTVTEGLPVPTAAVREPLPTPTEPATVAPEEKQPSAVGPSGTRGDAEAKADFASFAHQYFRDYINLADQKATFFFTGTTALLAFLYSRNVSARWLKPLMTWNILDTVAFVAMAALAGGAFLALLVVIPRTPGSRRGFLFWEAVAEYATGRQYADELWLLSPPSLFQVKAEHCFELAKVCRRKYRMLRWALWTGAVGLAGSLFVFLFL